MDKFTKDMIAGVNRNHQDRILEDKLKAISARRKRKVKK